MKATYSEEIAGSIFRFLVADNWHLNFHSEDGIFHFGLNLSNKIKNIDFFARLNASDYTIHCVCPMHADPDDRDMMCRIAIFLHLANYNLRNGNFELDIHDGEIRFKSHVDCDGLTSPTTAMVRNSIYICASMFKHYGDAIYHIIHNGMTPEEAIALSEECKDACSSEDDEDVSEIFNDGTDSPEVPPVSEEPAVPDLGVVDDDDIDDLLQLIQEMNQPDEA